MVASQLIESAHFNSTLRTTLIQDDLPPNALSRSILQIHNATRIVYHWKREVVIWIRDGHCYRRGRPIWQKENAPKPTHLLTPNDIAVIIDGRPFVMESAHRNLGLRVGGGLRRGRPRARQIEMYNEQINRNTFRRHDISLPLH